MKILVLTDDYPPYVAGGAGVMAHRLVQELTAQGHVVRVVSTVQKKEYEGEDRIFSSYHERWRSYVSLYKPFLIKKIERIIQDFKPDIVHAHNIHGHISYYALVVAKKYAPVYMTAHDIMPFYPGTFTEFINSKDGYKVTPALLLKKFKYRYNPFRNIFVRYCLSKIDKIIAVSFELKKALEENGIGNITVIHNGINTHEWPVIKGDSHNILFQGRLSGAKGGSLIIDALKIITKEFPEANLVVLGRKDSYAEKMEEKAKGLGIQNNIVFKGWLDQDMVKQAYGEVAVVVVPSVCFDSFPNGNLEAFAAGKPVVATCFGGSKEIVEDDVNGYIVNPFEINTLAEKISLLLRDKEMRNQFGENGRKLVEAKYSVEHMAKQHIDLWKSSSKIA